MNVLLLCVSSNAYTKVSGLPMVADDSHTGTIIDVQFSLPPVTQHETVEAIASSGCADAATSGAST